MFFKNRRDPRASRYENLAKIKNRRLELEDDRRKGWKEPTNMCTGAGKVCAEGEKAGYDMSGMLYDPIFH